MKKSFLILALITGSMVLASCGGGNADQAPAQDSTAVAAAELVTWMVDPSASNVRWECGTAGAMVYSHFGNIKLKEGKITTEGNAIKAGGFVVDMTSINPTDSGYSEDHPASDLVGHLSSPDFFDVANNPVASFNVKSAEGNTLIGDLTVRGKTNEEKVMIEGINMAPDGTMTATGKLVFDRQKYDVKWAHYVKDVILNDEIHLDISLVGKKG